MKYLKLILAIPLLAAFFGIWTAAFLYDYATSD